MSVAELVSLALIAIVTVWTPGPNNALLAASGARFGFVATIPHLLGVTLGFPIMVIAIGLGLGGIFLATPAVGETLRWLGAAVLFWLAWKIATAPVSKGASRAERPWRFYHAVIFQWINPKAWVTAISVLTQFVDEHQPLVGTLICALVYLVAVLTATTGWAGLGASLQKWLADPLRFRVFSLTMAGLLLFTVIGLLTSDLQVR